MRDRVSGLVHIAHLKHSTNMETYRSVKENFTTSIHYLSFNLYKYFASLPQTWILLND